MVNYSFTIMMVACHGICSDTTVYYSTYCSKIHTKSVTIVNYSIYYNKINTIVFICVTIVNYTVLLW